MTDVTLAFEVQKGEKRLRIITDSSANLTEVGGADFVSVPTGSGASYVASRYLESWGTATPEGTQETADKNIFTSLTVPTREGYKFDGWYAYAAVDAAGEITNLGSQVSVDVQYVDVNNKFNLYTETVSTQAVRITDGSGAIVYGGKGKPSSRSQGVCGASGAVCELSTYQQPSNLSKKSI